MSVSVHFAHFSAVLSYVSCLPFLPRIRPRPQSDSLGHILVSNSTFVE